MIDRTVVARLIQNGMRYPAGRHQIWIHRCFQISVHPGRVVEVDEYEGYAERKHMRLNPRRSAGINACRKMFHKGRSILHSKDNRVIEQAGAGWDSHPVE